MNEMNEREISARTNSFVKADEVVIAQAEPSVGGEEIVYAAQTGNSPDFVNEPGKSAPLRDLSGALSSDLSNSLLKDLSNALLKDGDCDCSWFAGNGVAVQKCGGCNRDLRLFCDAPLHWRGRHWHLRCAFEDAKKLFETATTLW